jgi:FkbM family methyltransferase
MASTIERGLLKLQQIVSFFGSSKHPLSLTADALRLKRATFVAATRDGIKLRLNPNCGESFTFFENLIRRDYLGNGIVLRPGDTVVDIGANIGSFTVLAASIVGPKGRVVALEPIEDTFSRLLENVELNGYRNVECQRVAVGAKAGNLSLQVHPKSALSTACLNVEASANPKSALSTAYLNVETGANLVRQTVQCQSLEQVCREHHLTRVNLLKVDCEGSEHEIFETLPPELAARIDQIALEYHFVEGTTPIGFRRTLQELGFEVQIHPYCWTAFNTRAPADTCE